eukprot:806187-Ditylum_brightwellii.AAC.1
MKCLKNKNDGSQQSCHSAAGERSQCYNKEELNTIIGKSIKVAMKKECCDCACPKEHNTINNFSTLSLSSSNSNNISHTCKRGRDADDGTTTGDDNVKVN